MNQVFATSLRYLRMSLVSIVAFQLAIGALLAVPARADVEYRRTTTPSKHVIIIVGENRTFDHLFATYKPKDGQSVDNLLSRGIINEDGTPGPHYAKAHQFSADVTGSNLFQLSPKHKSLYSFLPVPLNGGPTDVCANNKICSLGDATASENGLSDSPVNYYEFLTTGGTGLTGKVPDSTDKRSACFAAVFHTAAGSLPTHQSP